MVLTRVPSVFAEQASGDSAKGQGVVPESDGSRDGMEIGNMVLESGPGREGVDTEEPMDTVGDEEDDSGPDILEMSFIENLKV